MNINHLFLSLKRKGVLLHIGAYIYMNKTQFNEALVSLVEYASANANHITKKDVEIYFKDILTDEKMYDAIFAYLKESKISIDDMDENIIDDSSDVNESNTYNKDFTTKNVVESEEELEFLEMYKHDIENIEPLSSDEKLNLISQLKNKDSLAMAKLTENLLSTVHRIALNNRGRGLTLGDLIQEGNIGLILGLSEFEGETSEFDPFIENKITEAIDEAVNIQISSERIGSHLANRMNNLDDISRDLTEKLGHAPSISELSSEMNISEDEVDTIIRTSLNVLSVNQAEEE